MLRTRLTVCSMTALLLGGTAAAQSPGTLLIGGFGQYTYFGDQNRENDFEFDRLGYGGRIGAYLTPQLNLEADGMSATIAAFEGAPEEKYSAIAARLLFSFPRGNATSFHIGAGGVLKNIRDEDLPISGAYDFGVEGGLGFKLGFAGIALRLDGLFDYFPGPSNWDIRAQAGLQFSPDLGMFFGGGDMDSGSMWAPVAWWDDMDAPRPGTVELGGFGQWTWFDENAGRPGSVPKDGLGFGGRLGVFLSNPRWQLEGDGYYSPHDNEDETPGPGEATDINAHALALRLNYNFPLGNLLGSESQFILGLGAVRTNYSYEPSAVAEPADDYTYGYGVSGLAGLRLGIVNRVALRLDGVVDYMPNYDPEANLNIHARAGLSFLIGGARPEPMCPYAGLESIPASSPNCVAPLPPPPPPAACPYDPSILSTDPRCVAPRAFVDTTAITAPIYFDFDRSTIRPDAAATLDRKIPWLQANPGMRIRIEGNADERGSDEYNLALGQRRAASAKRYLVERGIAADRFDLVSHGEERPVCTESNEGCWQQNRRDDFFVVRIGGDGVIRTP
jgi:peptidoglycan-associated lipoprotein